MRLPLLYHSYHDSQQQQMVHFKTSAVIFKITECHYWCCRFVAHILLFYGDFICICLYVFCELEVFFIEKVLHFK